MLDNVSGISNKSLANYTLLFFVWYSLKDYPIKYKFSCKKEVKKWKIAGL